mmetsp:Transcript_15788/g.38810  ORF Transcript_15788/g.38810 Transcript_15788/m.38810 type:complete len:233 (-) Transcript_15788:162-860(-)
MAMCHSADRPAPVNNDDTEGHGLGPRHGSKTIPGLRMNGTILRLLCIGCGCARFAYPRRDCPQDAAAAAAGLSTREADDHRVVIFVLTAAVTVGISRGDDQAVSAVVVRKSIDIVDAGAWDAQRWFRRVSCGMAPPPSAVHAARPKGGRAHPPADAHTVADRPPPIASATAHPFEWRTRGVNRKPSPRYSAATAPPPAPATLLPHGLAAAAAGSLRAACLAKADMRRAMLCQ